MRSQSIPDHCAEIDRCNQRGARMLSIVDLIEAGTFTEELATYSLAAIGAGASFMVGAVPGGAGKTTVMGALLNFVPADTTLVPADSLSTVYEGLEETGMRCCYICHEIGAGPYYAYLWDEPLRRYFDLPTVGHMLATNLHADTLAQARDQVCGDNGVAPEAFRRMNLAYFLAIDGRGWKAARRVATVWESDGSAEHRLLYKSGEFVRPSTLVPDTALATAATTLREVLASDTRTISDVRSALCPGSRHPL